MLPVRPPETCSLTTRDGVRLDADVYRPDAPGNFPVLLMRQPYGRRIASTVVFAHPQWYAAQGYVVVIQDVRGRGTSQGRFRLFADDVADGGESVAWAAKLGNGRVGMYGFSYQGHTQLLALAAGRPELQALCPGMATWDVRSDWAYEGGAFGHAGNIAWGLQMGAEQARLADDEEAFLAFNAAPPQPEALCRYAHYSHYQDWATRGRDDPYWREISVGAALAQNRMDVPMLHIGGWFDFMLRGTLRIHREAVARSTQPQRLVVGPWTHMPWGRRVGAMDFGPQAHGFVDQMQIAWFDRFLKDTDNRADRAAPVQLFDLAAHEWRAYERWPAQAPRRLYPHGGGLAAATPHGALQDTPAPPAQDVFVHDPWRPVPSLGGHNGDPGGCQDRAEIDQRNDVATYTTAPLTAPLSLAGDVSLTLDGAADAETFDVSAVLSRVTPDGRVYNLTQAHARRDAPGPFRMDLRALCATLAPGEALRLSLAGAAFPAFAVNPGVKSDRLIDARVITLTVATGANTYLEIPE